ncbi:DUF5994 family protein [Actinoplanes sp. NPDC026619]|uniref:DUF5994 family protein n=1 Tax=Actinoplanes sp. NPDC026619 TaxID=3155798 RepID=UPI0033DD26FE
MAPSTTPDSSGPSRVRFEPLWDHHTWLAGTWWPGSGDPATELPELVPALDRAHGRVTRLLLSAAGWTARPHHVFAAGHAVSVSYQAGQSPCMMTVLCADGSSFTMHVAQPGPVPENAPVPVR